MGGIRTQFGSDVVRDGMDWGVERGEELGVVGGSGTGKSVRRSTIAGLLRPAMVRSSTDFPVPEPPTTPSTSPR